MSNFEIEARLHEDFYSSSRRASLVAAIRRLTPVIFDEPTSSWLISYSGTATELATYLRNGTVLYRDGRDMLLVKEVVVRDWAGFGITDTDRLAAVIAHAALPPVTAPVNAWRAANTLKR
ncbi:hypothetical protein LJR016_004301 [Devosia sp. LjRoot16]|uniref:hypothetical protein n=1 Tax=Devosia sp. LjRoot16 TaxID=3342271 RepID=UPI003ED17019